MAEMPFGLRSRYNWKLRTRSLALGERSVVMGVLNTTPDSFSDGGAFSTPAAGIDFALAMFEEGADIVDIGGESTRPGKRRPVTVQEEIDRVIPVVEGVLHHRPNAILSIDTYKGQTAAAALAAGVEIVNDVSGFLWDEEMSKVCVAARCGVVLMHTRGRPEEWRTLPPLPQKEVVPLVMQGLQKRLQGALDGGVERERIVLDPGFGFGIILEQNYALLAGLEELGSLGQPVLAGVSRKAFLGRALSQLNRGVDVPVGRRENASLAAVTAALLAGAHLVRVHDVRSSREAAVIADAILAAGAGG
ncbi:MAG TPA: dihydropteroate synthase [Acidobacteriaceae bacterium]|nr:dihydropteroate synthase [Acidobacteriaceae bacterium]